MYQIVRDQKNYRINQYNGKWSEIDIPLNVSRNLRIMIALYNGKWSEIDIPLNVSRNLRIMIAL